MLSVVREYVETSMPCVDCHLSYLIVHLGGVYFEYFKLLWLYYFNA